VVILQQTQWYKSKTPWYEPPASFFKQTGREPKTAIVIGAGLAGASAAYQLAQLGLQVQVLEQAHGMAQGASGNLAGALHPLVTADWNLRSQWYAQGLQASLAFLQPRLATGQISGELSGLMHLAVDDKNRQRMQQAAQRVAHLSELAHWCDAAQASQKLGGKTAQSGLFFPNAGWLNPPSIVKYCLAQSGVSVKYDCPVLAAEYDKRNQTWLINTQHRGWQADVLVVATGAISGLNEVFSLPIRPVKGQVTQLKPEHQAWGLNCAVAHQGYSAPAPKGEAVTGATFEAPDLSPESSEQADQQNRAMVQASLPDWLCSTTKGALGRVSFRPTTPDHLPIIGAQPDFDWMMSQYFSASPSHTPYRFPPVVYQPGLYVSNGHGARGLMSVFLAAEIIGAQLVGKPPPLSAKLYAASHPARFAVRHWQRG
jgi:tRNA 5-methylaminomethyl-2-thiouridine biosynthesis bifunctional protein